MEKLEMETAILKKADGRARETVEAFVQAIRAQHEGLCITRDADYKRRDAARVAAERLMLALSSRTAPAEYKDAYAALVAILAEDRKQALIEEILQTSESMKALIEGRED